MRADSLTARDAAGETRVRGAARGLIPRADPRSTDPDAIDPATVRWTVDSSFVVVEPYAQLPAAVLLTTKRAGGTLIEVSGTTRSGKRVRAEAKLSISNVTPDDLERGEIRYESGLAGKLVPEYTPTQLMLYSDEQLIDLFSRGALPRGGVFSTPFMKQQTDPQCVYRAFHTWQIDVDTLYGLVWKLRSLAPATIPEVDLVRRAAAP